MDPTTNTLNVGDSTLTIRVIKSFPYRTVKPFIARHLDLEKVTVGDLKELTKKEVATASGWKPYRNVNLDALKMYTVAHGHKTTNLIINLEEDEALWLSDDSRTLASYGLENETELSFFNKQEYEDFVKDPQVKW